MVNMASIGGNTTKASNKWLYVVLFITLLVTAWTAFHGEDANEEVSNELEVKKSPSDEKGATGHIVDQSERDQESTSKKSESALTSSPIPWQKLKREFSDSQSYDVFKVHSWVVVPPAKKPPPPPPPPPPQAPPAPFTYVGKLENLPKGTQFFLMENDKLLSVLIGEKITPQWILDSEDAGSIRLTYIPLDLKQVLSKSAKPVVMPTAVEANEYKD